VKSSRESVQIARCEDHEDSAESLSHVGEQLSKTHNVSIIALLNIAQNEMTSPRWEIDIRKVPNEI
jgi:hypothetical protein